MAEVNSMYKNNVLSHFHPNGTTAVSIIYHELGHAIEAVLNNRYQQLNGYTADAVVLRAAKRFSAERNDGRQIRTINDAKTYAEFISRYAVTNHYGLHGSSASFATYETLAEAVGDFVEQGQHAHRFSQLIWDELMKELRSS